jgi:chromosome segregation ATPase
MEMTPREQNTINNFTAQYTSILGNIQVANDKLTAIFADVKKAEASVYRLTTQIVDKTKELDSLFETEVKIKLEIEHKERELLSERANLEADKKEFKADKEAELKRVKELRDNLQVEILKANHEIEDLNEKHSEATREMTRLQAHVSMLEDQVAILEDKKSTLDEEVVDLEKSIETTRLAHSQERNQLLQELDNLKVLVNEEVEKIKNPTKNLEARENELDRREKNFLILVNRFRREFVKLHPGQHPVI